MRLSTSRLARVCAGVLACAATAVLVPAAAQADVGTVVPGQLAPVTPGPGPSTQDAMPGRFQCTNPYVSIQASPSGFVIGNCRQGNTILRQQRGTGPLGQLYAGGSISGDFAGCGWIGQDSAVLLDNSTSTACENNSIGYNLNELASSYNSTPTDDGYPTTLAIGCDAYANFRPFESGQKVSGFVGFLPAGTSMLWRYVAKYPEAGTGAAYVMGRRADASAGQGNWVWVPQDCYAALPASVPAG